MKTYQFKGLLDNSDWIIPAFVRVDDEGRILEVASSTSHPISEAFDNYLIPGFQNAHSHAFQYAMAGLAERHATNQTPDDFWSWREAMYDLALRIGPDDLEHIATMLYSEMLRHGYTHVAEFHYVHHEKNGEQFANLSEMGERLVAAAKKVGIGITLVPIFYQKGGFGKAPNAGQIRFISASKDDYLKLLEASEQSTDLYQHANLGIGIHSMRGVEPKVIAELAANGPQDLPFHIHVSEQLKEIEDSIAYLGQRPVEWMLNNIEMNDRYHLVHATHLIDMETEGIAKSGANVVLCPSTEGNLGDGIFPLRQFQSLGGNWSIGTDSHIGINPLEELRILDYGQRLISHKRNTFYSTEEGDSGKYAIAMSWKAGRKAMNKKAVAYFEIGDYFNGVMIDAQVPLLANTRKEDLASTILYATDAAMLAGTFANGELVVKAGQHRIQDQIRNDFNKTIKNLKNRS
ncbi:formimidoylglutamate deiminase [Crocinitomix catalasitica]|uniref:formimidoylglutamate deiminase n=1 Tax=Crocinitomix catalasitica TaxID=184607 RepID=UPI00048124C5|nr:formimidoylglutamate deiminase [Crocinitomix catalasitica]